jgi:hypothetical protein
MRILIRNYFYCIYFAYPDTHTHTHTQNSARYGRRPAAAREERHVHTLKLGVSQMSQTLHGIAHL